ncbi:3-oxo-tetronate kinase [Actinomadura miaoliensis]|uniref:3-oxo-tetronate kinase n=1 Tax=Actinomadura miaoliensis TaxID=430685 RepID=A0ABP7WMP8_9ACTN
MTVAPQRGPLLGCVADDYTGGTDVAAALRRAGLRTALLFGRPEADTPPPECDAVVVALKTRTAPVAEAVSASLAVREWLAGHGVPRVYVKYCSTFDSTDEGNIGPIVDAVLDAAGTVQTVVCPAAPEHGRTVYQGHLFVGDRLLSQSPMRHHPLTPMTDPDLVAVLSRQTPHPVGLLPLRTVRRGGAAVRAALDELGRRGVRHVVADATCDEDLTALAAGTAHLPVVTGAAGLARAVGHLLPGAGAVEREETPPLSRGPGIVLSGSCSAATLGQVEHARKVFPSYRLAPDGAPDELAAGVRAWLDAHAGRGPVMVYSSAAPGERGDARAGEVLEQALAEAARHAVGLGVRRIVVAGGETSGAVVRGLGIGSVIVTGEADRGVPWCLTTGEPRLALLLKSGNFGRDDLFVRAMEETE